MFRPSICMVRWTAWRRSRASDGHGKHFTAAYQRRVLENVGHNVPQEAPQAVADAILQLCKDATGVRGYLMRSHGRCSRCGTKMPSAVNGDARQRQQPRYPCQQRDAGNDGRREHDADLERRGGDLVMMVAGERKVSRSCSASSARSASSVVPPLVSGSER